jgi:glycosyltransferase involved in cell wall biosynthesis
LSDAGGRVRFVLVNLPYPPDPTPTGRVLQDLASVLVARGHEVHVLCSDRANDGGPVLSSSAVPSGVRLHRLPATGFGRVSFLSRMIDYASFYGLVAVSLGCLLSRADVILNLTTPPYLGLLTKATSILRGSRTAQWVMDVYPDILAAAKMLDSQSWMYRFLRALRGIELRSADLVLTLGPFMAGELLKYGPRSVLWEPLCPEKDLAPWPEAVPNGLRAERGWAPGELVLMYSGNMGLGHPFGEFMGAAKHLGPAGPRWAFVGSTGLHRRDVEEFARAHPEARIQTFPAVPFERLRENLCAADVHLVSLHYTWQGLAVPSKLQGVFAVGKPVIFVGGRRNEIAHWIEESGAGWIVPEGDLPGLLRAIEESRDPAERRRRGRAAHRYAEQHFGRGNYERVAQTLENVARRR